MSEPGSRMAPRLRELLRFCVVGGSTFLIGLFLVFVFTELLRLHYLLSLGVAWILVNVGGWWFNRTWTFRVAARRNRAEVARYLAVNLAGFALTLILVHLLVAGAGLHYLLASALVALGMTGLNFLVHRAFSFRL